MSLPPYAVLDIDATLSDVRHRLHHLRRRPKNWDGFFAAAGADGPLPEGLAAGRTVAVLVDDDIAVCTAAERAGFTVLRADWALDELTEPTLFDAQESEGRT